MLKQLLTELREVMRVLEKAGYFDDAKAAPVKRPFRHRRGHERAIENLGRKLTPEDALEIYKENRLTHAELAEMFEISESNVYQIKTGRIWYKVTGAKRPDMH